MKGIKMDNKGYKAIVKKAVKRFERLQELELKDRNGIKNRVNWFIAEYIRKNQLKEVFHEELLSNSETQIYLLRHNKKIPIMRVGNKVIKTNLIKRLDNLINFLNKEEKEKLVFIKKLETLNWKYKFVYDKELGIHKLVLENSLGEYMALINPTFYYGMIVFENSEVKIIHDDKVKKNNFISWKTKSYTIERRSFEKRAYLTIDDLKHLLDNTRK